MSAIQIPLSPQQQKFSVALADATYLVRFTYDEADQGGWIMDIGAQDGTLLLAGVPLVTGSDLLAQYGYLGLGGALVLVTDRDAGETPTFEGLGITSHLYFIPNG